MKLPENFDFTQSNLQDYVNCSYWFYLRYYLKTKWPALVVEDAVQFEMRGQAGARFHRLLQQYLLGVPEARLSELAASDPEAEIGLWWESFLLHVPPWLSGGRFVETILTTNIAGYRLLAKYDLILVKDSGDLIIFDWKTSQKVPRKEQLLERIQTRLYRYILSKSGSTLTNQLSVLPETVTMFYWYAPHPDIPLALPYNQRAFNSDKAYFSSLIHEILDKDEKDFIKTADVRHCRYCVYRSHCDRGVKAGDLSEFEAFDLLSERLQLETDFDEISEIEF